MVTGRFSEYRPILAKYAGIGKCGHAIAPGHTIGYSKRHGCVCPACWATWAAENAEAQQYEDSLPASMSENY